MKFKAIVPVLALAVVAAGGLVYFGSQQSIRLDAVTMDKDGVSQSVDGVPFQFASGDTLYRSWDGSQNLESAAASSDTQLGTGAMIRFTNGDLMFTQPAQVIDPAGAATSATAKRTVAAQSDHVFSDGETTVDPLDVVRLSDRRYFFSAPATIVVDGEDVGTIEDTQIAIDKTGAATLTGADGKRQRYLGSLALRADDDHVFEVSAEVYRSRGQEIDLTKFGGSTNEMQVLAGATASLSAESTPGESAEPTADNTTPGSGASPGSSPTASGAAGSGTSDGNGSSNGSSTGTSDGAGASGSTNGTGTAPTPPAMTPEEIQQIQDLFDAIQAINAQQSLHIPSVSFSRVQPGATSVEAQVAVLDSSQALVGPVELRVTDASSGAVVVKQSVTAGQQSVSLGLLETGHDYKLGYVYSYDLGQGAGVQRIEGTDGYAFTTSKVTAFYKPSQVKSTSMTVSVSLDTSVTGIASASLVVDKQGGFLGIGGGRVATAALSPQDLAGGGASVIISGLDQQESYLAHAELTMTDGTTLRLNDSTLIVTPAATRVSVSSVRATPAGTVAIDYEWASDEYSVDEVSVAFDADGVIGSEVISRGPGLLEVLPSLDGSVSTAAIEGTLTVVAHDRDGESRTFEAPLDVVSYEAAPEFELLAPTPQSPWGTLSVTLTDADTSADRGALAVTFQRRLVGESSESSWRSLGTVPFGLKPEQSGLALLPLDASSDFAEPFSYRAIVLRDDVPLFDLPLAAPNSAVH